MSPRKFAHGKLVIITTAVVGIHNLGLLHILEIKSNFTLALSKFFEVH